MILKCLAIFIGGGIGSVLRFLITTFAKKTLMLPIAGTFSANIIGCFILGYIFALTLNKIDSLPPILKLFITVGFLGGLTTFSTLNLEVFELIKNGKILYGLLYFILSCIVGLLVTYVGYALYSKI